MSSYNVILVLPGTTGSTLVTSKNVTVWPDVVAGWAMISPQTAATILEDQSRLYGSLQTGVVSGWNDTTKGYGSLLATLAQASNAGQPYCANANNFSSTQNVSGNSLPATLSSNLVIGFPYDWRQNNTVSAASLQAFINFLCTQYSNIGQINLVGHSMGGIVSRTYLEVVGASDSNRAKVANLITLGTPHLGAPLALQAINGTLDLTTYVGPIVIDDITISPDRFEAMVWSFVDNGYGNSTYELLPPPLASGMPSTVQQDVQFITDATQNTSTTCTVFSATSAVSQALTGEDLNGMNLSTAQTLLASLGGVYAGGSSLPNYYCIYGLSSVYPTCTAMTLGKGDSWTNTNISNGGDQIVPQWSAVFQGGPVKATYQALQVSPYVKNPPPAGSVNHLQLPGSPDAQAQIVTWLGLGR